MDEEEDDEDDVELFEDEDDRVTPRRGVRRRSDDVAILEGLKVWRGCRMFSRFNVAGSQLASKTKEDERRVRK